MIVNRRGLVLALERADAACAWQLPQGGLEESEEPLAGALREVQEETGIAPDLLELLDTYPGPLAYELPPEFRKTKTGRGQVQYWFLFRFLGSDAEIAAGGGEFRDWKWIGFDALLASAARFREPVYRRLAERFQPYLAPA
mgnify:CR=1 FL=1